MKKFFALIIGAVLALAIASSPAFARNEVINGVFHNVDKLDDTYSGVGDANWRAVVPDGSDRIMYFEKCWRDNGGWMCQYEVIVSDSDGDDSNHDGDLVADADPDWPDQDHQWRGEFESAKKHGGKWTATVTIDGAKKDFGPYTLCKLHNGKQWCY